MMLNGMPAPALGSVDWRKSSASIGTSNCAEIAAVGRQVAIRQNTDPTGPALLMRREEFAGFVAAARAGEYDDLLLA